VREYPPTPLKGGLGDLEVCVNSDANRKKKPSNDELQKLKTDCALSWLQKFSAGFRVELSLATQKIYLNELTGYSLTAMMKGCQRTLREWREASKMAPLSFVLERVESALAEERMNGDTLTRGDKPADWEPMTREQAEMFIRELKARVK
jgi:hypothetical protein